VPSEVFQLYLLLSLKDIASGGLDRVDARLRATGKEGRVLLRNFQDLRQEMSRDWAIAGAGVGTLMLMNKGVKVAGDYESAMTTLKMSIQEVDKETGRINTASSVRITDSSNRSRCGSAINCLARLRTSLK